MSKIWLFAAKHYTNLKPSPMNFGKPSPMNSMNFRKPGKRQSGATAEPGSPDATGLLNKSGRLIKKSGRFIELAIYSIAVIRLFSLRLLFASGPMTFLMLMASISLAVYCFMDSRMRRMKNPWLWALFGLIPIGNYFAVAILHGNRWLKEGETRSGGRGWDSCRWLAITSTMFLAIQLITYMIFVVPTDVSKRLAAGEGVILIVIGISLGVGFIVFLWFIIVRISRFMAMRIKKDVKETGPTGPLAALENRIQTREQSGKGQDGPTTESGNPVVTRFLNKLRRLGANFPGFPLE